MKKKKFKQKKSPAIGVKPGIKKNNIMKNHIDLEKLKATSFILNLPGMLRADTRIAKNFRLQILVCELFDLAKAHGYAFASNKFLSQKMGVTTRTIERDLTKLEMFGYIRRETTFGAFKKVRRIYVGDIFSNNFYEPTQMSVANRQEWRKEDNIPINKKKVSKETKEKKGKPPPPASPSSPPLSFGFENFKNVHFTEKEYEALKKKFSEEVLKDLIESLSLYKAKHPSQKQTNDYAYILDFHRRHTKDKSDAYETYQTRLKIKNERNRDCVQKMMMNLKAIMKEKKFEVRQAPMYFELRRKGEEPFILEWDDPYFEDKLQRALEARKLTLY